MFKLGVKTFHVRRIYKKKPYESKHNHKLNELLNLTFLLLFCKELIRVNVNAPF